MIASAFSYGLFGAADELACAVVGLGAAGFGVGFTTCSIGVGSSTGVTSTIGAFGAAGIGAATTAATAPFELGFEVGSTSAATAPFEVEAFTVPFEDGAFTVPFEDGAFVVPAELAALVVPADVTALVVPAEVAGFVAAAAFVVPGEVSAFVAPAEVAAFVVPGDDAAFVDFAGAGFAATGFAPALAFGFGFLDAVEAFAFVSVFGAATAPDEVTFAFTALTEPLLVAFAPEVATAFALGLARAAVFFVFESFVAMRSAS